MSRYWKVITGFLAISILLNMFLLFRVTTTDQTVGRMLRRIQYMEENLDNRVARVIEDMDYMNFRAQSVVEDLRWEIGENFSNPDNTVPLSIQFKLKHMDPGANVYVSLEQNGEEPKLIPANQSNETTFQLNEVVSIFNDVHADLVIEKYGIKQIETLFRVEEIYRKFSGDMASRLENVKYGFDIEESVLHLEFDAFAEFIQNPMYHALIQRAEVVFIRNGIALDRYPLERVQSEEKTEYIAFEGSTILETMRITHLDSLEVAVIIQDETGFVYENKLLRVQISGDVPQLTQLENPKPLVRR